jgi:uncharacterized protein (DUF1697 family)
MPVLISMLRGVNVGAHNRIKMDALRALYESLALRHPQTYVQSGNVLFRTDRRDPIALAKRIEDAIQRGFGFRPTVILRTSAELRDVMARSPFAKRGGIEPAKLLVYFLANDPGAEVPRSCAWTVANSTSIFPMAWRARRCRGQFSRGR